ncbi:MAG: bifunctional 4-hydroxy-2-oxoglutarate aldolase/2-dehydro-3-deoxy-phosphogluconate aldolase [Phycisphaerae bacterium]|jgi:2-dehydro-3-deoxyphosphogluconate aldolase/(4S)-4-hydroxy-2-oxoglutarate aldolase
MNKIFEQINHLGIIAVVVIDEPENAVQMAKALFDNGIKAIENTLRTPAALETIKIIKKSIPEMLVGAGTVLTVEQVADVYQAGGDFAVSPGLNAKVVKKANEIGLPFAPGIVTPSDIEAAIEMDCRVLKFFPAEASGGLDYLNSMAAPYQHLGLKYIPLGGLDFGNMKKYLESPLVSALGGSWLAPRKAIQAKNWSLIAENAKKAAEIVREVRSKCKQS